MPPPADLPPVEHEALQRQQQLEMALQAGKLGTWVMQLPSEKIEWSIAAEAVHGLAPGTFVGGFEQFMEMVHPEDRAAIRDNLAQLISTGTLDPITYRAIWPDGSVHWIEASGRILRDAQGTPIRGLGLVSDVTERRRSESALSAAEAKFRMLAIHAPVGIYQADLNGQCVFVNRHWCEIVGHPPEQILGSGWECLVHPDDRQPIVDAWNAFLKAGSDVFVSQVRFVNPARGTRSVVSSTASLRDVHHQLLGYVGAAIDITDQIQAEDAVRASQARLQGLLDNSNAVIYLKDLEGRYIVINRRFEEIFHIQAADIIGKTDESVHAPPEVLQHILANDRAVLAAKRPLEFEEVVHHHDQPRTYISVKFPIFDGGRLVGLGGVSTDITERKQASDQLRLESASLRRTIEFQDQERQLLAYDIHDGMLQYTVGALFQLQSLADAPGVPQSKIDDIAKLIGKVLDEGRRIMNGIRTPVLDDSGAVGAIQQLVDEEERAHCALEFAPDPDFGRLANKIEEAIFRITQEAMNNAIKHSRTKQLRIVLERRGDFAHLEIEDWGTGFNTGQTAIGIHGLRGMAERAKIAGGTCTIHSKPGQGTRVVADLPYLERADG
jgi:PAS domain S-box-containing protein